MESLGRVVTWAGIALVVLGLVLQLGPQIPLLGRLPGDIRIEREGLRVFVPITSCLVLSLAVTAISWLFARLRA